jgi:hypothetical protein
MIRTYTSVGIFHASYKIVARYLQITPVYPINLYVMCGVQIATL